MWFSQWLVHFPWSRPNSGAKNTTWWIHGDLVYIFEWAVCEWDTPWTWMGWLEGVFPSFCKSHKALQYLRTIWGSDWRLVASSREEHWPLTNTVLICSKCTLFPVGLKTWPGKRKKKRRGKKEREIRETGLVFGMESYMESIKKF